MQYLLTHSLLRSWLYAMKENPYEDVTNAKPPMDDFIHTLQRLPSVPTEAMMKGNDFEALVTAACYGMGDHKNSWYPAARKMAEIVRGGAFQYKAKRSIIVAGFPILLYGRLDVLKGGTIYDIKYSSRYERGNFFDGTQHPVYMEIIQEAHSFVYLISNGFEVWTEEYRRDETPDVYPIIERFLTWLEGQGLMAEYMKYWEAK